MDEKTPPVVEAGDPSETFALPPLRALLVGINRYVSSELRPLRGCVEDVEAARDLLVDDLGVPSDAVLVLRDEEATRAGVEAAFRSHLIAAGKRWTEERDGEEAPAFLFYFSGHGSQAPDLTRTEPDGQDETIVPHDARGDGPADIRDYELAAWLDELPGDNVTVVLDCCHSGAGTDRGRSTGPDELVRSAPPDERPIQPPRRTELGPTASVTIDERGRHVLLAACASHQRAYEHRRWDGVHHGLFSQALLPALARLRSRPDLTYRELIDDTRLRVSGHRRDQTPLGQGELDRVVFRTQRGHRRPVACVLERPMGRLVLDVGAVHGVREGYRFAVEVAAAEPLVVEVERTHAVTCEVRPLDGAAMPSEPVELGTPALLVRPELGPARLRVTCDDAATDELVGATVDGGPLEGLADAHDDPATADLHLAPVDGRWQVATSDGQPLVATDTLAEASTALAHLVRYAEAWEMLRELPAAEGADLGGPPGGATPDGCFSLRLRTVTVDDATGQNILDDPPSGGLPPGQRIAFEMHNATDQDLYLCLLAFGRDWDVRPVYPALGARSQRWSSGQTFKVGTERQTFTATLAEDEDERRDVVRLMVTTEPTAYVACELLPPPGEWAPARPLRPPPQQGPGSSAPRTAAVGKVEGEWACIQVEVVTRRAANGEPAPPDAASADDAPPDQPGGCGPT